MLLLYLSMIPVFIVSGLHMDDKNNATVHSSFPYSRAYAWLAGTTPYIFVLSLVPAVVWEIK